MVLGEKNQIAFLHYQRENPFVQHARQEQFLELYEEDGLLNDFF